MLTVVSYEQSQNGEVTFLYKIENKHGASVTISSYGGVITSLIVPDKDGNMTDVVLGYHNLEAQKQCTTFMGALIGRSGNRIAEGKVTIDGIEYQLAQNNLGTNHLHGGKCGFDKRIWNASMDGDALKLHLTSPDGDENYPGTLEVDVTYTFDDDNCLTITYDAVSDKDTLCNLTNHVYFNLSGHDSGSVEDQYVKLYADAYLPVSEKLIPTGELRPVEGTPFDFRNAKTIGQDILQEDEQLMLGGGYDHNFVLNILEGEAMWDVADAYSDKTDISLKCRTTQPGVQFYTGNNIKPGQPPMKDNADYQKRHGFCLETQNFPDAIHHEHFPDAILKAGKQYHHVTTYQFGVGKPFK